MHRFALVGLKFQRVRDAQRVVARLHLRKFVFAIFVRVNRGPHTIRRDELNHHSFR